MRTVQGDRAYGALYLSDEPRFEQFLPLAQDMINSFTIIDNANANGVATSITNTAATGQEDPRQQGVNWLSYENAT
ncbi:MAG: hypothetical protein M3115_05015 [Thermoproteota archaeon]|nr:hypothetical protein [Thermoproteota archaeon]